MKLFGCSKVLNHALIRSSKLSYQAKLQAKLHQKLQLQQKQTKLIKLNFIPSPPPNKKK